MDNFLDKSASPMYKFFDTVSKLIYINVLTILGIIVGLVFLGFFPAIFSAFYTTKRWVNDGNESIFKTYINYYKKNFWRINGLGLIMTLIALLSFIDFVYAYNLFITGDNITVFGVLFSMFSIMFLYVAIALFIYIPVTFVYFERFTTKEMLKFSLISVFGTPLLTFKMLLVVALSAFAFSIFISITVFLGISLPLYILIKMIKKRYRLFFVVKETNYYSFMNYKYLVDKTHLISLINKYGGDNAAIDRELFINNVLNNPRLNHMLSTVVLTKKEAEIVGFILVKNIDETHVEIDWQIANKKLNETEIYNELLSILITQCEELNIKTITTNLDKTVYHEQLKYFNTQKKALEDKGFILESTLQYKKELTKEVTR